MMMIYSAYKEVKNIKLISERFGINYKKAIKIIKIARRTFERTKRFRRELPGELFQFDLTRSTLSIKDNKIIADNKSNYYRRKEEIIRLWIGVIVDDATSNIYFQYSTLNGGESYINLVKIITELLSSPNDKLLRPFGLPKALLVDNASGFKKDNKFREVFEKLGVKVIFSKPNNPQTKGKVERAIRTIKERFEKDLFMSGFEGSLEELNELAKKFCHSFNMKKEKKFIPLFVKTIEKDKFLELFFNLKEKKIYKGYLEINGKFYYIPFPLKEEKVLYFIYENKVFVYCGNNIIELSNDFENSTIKLFNIQQKTEKTLTEIEFEEFKKKNIIFLSFNKAKREEKKEEKIKFSWEEGG